LTRKGVVENPPATTPVVTAAIDRQLAQRGLRKVDSGGDLQVSTMTLPDAEARIETISGFPEIQPWIGPQVPMTERYIRKGTLVVNLIDAKTKKSAWSGYVSDVIDKPEHLNEAIDRAVSDMFKHYPASP
jgi:hypothetical protein